MNTRRNRREVAECFEQQARALRSQTLRRLFVGLASALLRPVAILGAGRGTTRPT